MNRFLKNRFYNLNLTAQPEKAATDFAAQTLFQLSFRGVFQQGKALEQALYQYPDFGGLFSMIPNSAGKSG